jgi:acyl-CoA thioester hydrolase
LTVLGDWHGEKISLPRVSVACDYTRPVRFGDEVVIAVKVEKIGRSSLSYVFDFSQGNEPVARGRITAVFCQTIPGEGLKGREIPAGMRALLQ